MKYSVNHVTTYHTSEPVSVCHNTARLNPRSTAFQQCLDHRLTITPHESSRTDHRDAFGNHVTCFSSSTGYDKLVVASASEVDVAAPPPLDVGKSLAWEQIGERSRADFFSHDPRQFLFDSPRVYRDAEFRDYAAETFRPDRPVLDAVAALTKRIFDDFQYDQTATNVTTPIREVFASRAGVCQDFAHLQIAMLRSLGLPTRYVSGYILSEPADGSDALIGSAASHAWLSVFTADESLGNDGWVDTDPTNNKFLTDEYITLAWGRDYSDVAPLKGVFVGSGQHTLEVAVSMRPA